MEMYQVVLFSGINATLLAMIMLVHYKKGGDPIGSKKN